MSKIKESNKELIKKKEKIPYPFLKWAGGKRQLISQMEAYFPPKFNQYIEPFVGGGAVYFYLCYKNMIKRNSILIDNNEELINTYRVIKRNTTELITSLKNFINTKEYYYEIRNRDRDPDLFYKMSDIEKASRTIYLNKCCYNGLYRVNRIGQFNVPFGKYKNPNFYDEKNLQAVHNALQNAEIIHGSFEICLNFAKKGDFVYLDPPYHPLSETSSFTNYTRENFGVKSQKKLFEIFKELDERGCNLILSNSYNDFTLDLYKNYEKVILTAKRAINCNASKRGKINEILITN